jgi:hypothetical protein
MTVTAAEARIEYAGNGTTKVFAYPYQFYQNSDLEVWLFNDTTGEGVHQIVGQDYTVTGAMNVTGGSLTFTVAPPAGYTLIIINDPDIVQATHYVNADDFPADSHEAALDRLTKICQRLSDRIDRAVKAPDYAPEDQVPDADTLVNLVNDAQEAAAEAESSAANASNSENLSAQSAGTAVDAATAASASANQASISAASALGSANSATNSATQAANSAAAAQVAEVEWKGNWSASVQYVLHDAVFFSGSSYIGLADNINSQPDTHPAIWGLLAQQGAPGAPGSGAGDMLRANNLNDVLSPTSARTNLGLGNSATLDVGTTASTVAAGNDPRIVGAAPLASPVFTGNPQAPTPTAGDNDLSIATTQFVHDAVAAGVASVPAPVPATAAEYIANSAPTKMLTPGAAWSAANFYSLTDAATVTPDFSLGIDFFWPIAGARTLANPLNAKVGQKGIILINQDAAGGRTITAWGSAWKFPGGVKPTLTAGASAADAISYWVYAPGFILCTFSAGFA